MSQNSKKALEQLLDELEELIFNKLHSGDKQSQEKIEELIKDIDKSIQKAEEQFVRCLENIENIYLCRHIDIIKDKYKSKEISNLFDNIAGEGRKYRNILGEDFRKAAYRLLEQIRVGKKSDLNYSILRIFNANGEKMPPSLLKAFNPKYDTEVFKTLIYAFVGEVIKLKEDEKQKKSKEDKNV